MAKNEHRYYYIKNYSNKGEMAISHHVFETIAVEAVKKVKGASVYKGKTSRVNIYRPVSCEMKKNGKIELSVDVSLKKGVDVKTTCEKIKEEITNDLLLAVETINVNVSINVANIGD
ncbi:MAG: alkaline shock response membrane anchor protein AmaP [Bacilli bacterium]|nr:alkaline shock response membrane anchor protein AmaP [Bacilli bacterium]